MGCHIKEREARSTYGIKVKLDILGRGADRDGTVVLNVVLDVDQGNSSVSGSADVSVADVHLVDLGLGVVLVVGVARQGNSVAVLGRELERRGIGDGQDGGGQGDKGCDSHYEIIVFIVELAVVVGRVRGGERGGERGG